MTEAANVISVASIANAVVKSSQEMGTFEWRLVNSMIRINRVMKQQKHQVNMHQAQYDELLCPTEATRLKMTHDSTTSNIRTMPTGTVSERVSSVTMMSSVSLKNIVLNIS